MALSQESMQRIHALRNAALSRELSDDELREAITIMRQDRIGAAVVSATAKTRATAAKTPVNVDDLLSRLGAPSTPE